MDYRFMREFLDIVDNTEFLQSREIPYRMIAYASEKLGEKRFHKYYFNSVKEAAELMERRYGKENLPLEDPELEYKLGKNMVTKDQCLFLTFLLLEEKVPLKKKSEEERKEGSQENLWKFTGILNRLYRSIRKDPLICSCMEDAILYFCLASEQSWYTWVDLLREWRQLRKEDDLWKQKHQQWKTMSYAQFKHWVEQGTEAGEGNGRKTQSTYQEADRKLQEHIQEYCKNRKKKVKLAQIFPQDIRNTLENAKWRRTWYLYRLISMGIDQQKRQILDAMETWRRWGGARAEKEFRKAVNDCWLKTNYTRIRKLLTEEKKCKEAKEMLEGYLFSCPITVEHIVREFNICLCEATVSVFAKPKFRLGYYLQEDKQPRTREEQALVNYMVCLYFNSQKDLERIMKKEEVSFLGGMRNAAPFCKVLSGQVPATKELLLLTALVVREQGCSEITYNYIWNQMMKNCRLEVEANDDRRFDQFVKNTLEGKGTLRENARKLEKCLLEEGKGAVFYNIIHGKETE